MDPPPRETVERRRIPGASRWLSALTITLDPPAVAPPAADARTVAQLRRAAERGVTTFDVAQARFPERAETMIAIAFPAPGPEVSAIVGRSVESLAREHGSAVTSTSSEALGSALQGSLELSQKRLGAVPISVVEWEEDLRESSAGPEGAELPSLPPGTHPVLPIATRLRRSSRALPKTHRGPALFAGEFSLVEHGPASLFHQADPTLGPALIALDPFSNGRLDGSHFAASGLLGRPGDRPIDVRRLHHEFDPILRLSFLTDGRRRTLAQAAIRFVLGRPWVVTCVIPLPAPERFEEILGYGSTPEITEEELSHLGLVK